HRRHHRGDLVQRHRGHVPADELRGRRRGADGLLTVDAITPPASRVLPGRRRNHARVPLRPSTMRRAAAAVLLAMLAAGCATAGSGSGSPPPPAPPTSTAATSTVPAPVPQPTSGPT